MRVRLLQAMGTMDVLLTVAGLALLTAGGELLVRGASRLAVLLRVAPLVIGLTVVAFGTSSPELAVSLRSAWAGQADLALGNVVGSNIFNVLFILGLSALLSPLVVDRKLVRFDVPVMIVVCLLPTLLAVDGLLSRWEGGLLVAGVLVYVVVKLRSGRRREPPPTAEALPSPGRTGIAVAVAQTAAGLALLTLGAGWLVRGAVLIARSLGISELIIGVTLVAAGTSLPEVAASVVATLRGERDLAVGNVVGSNIFNVLAVLGGAALLGPGGVEVNPAARAFDLPVMIAAAVACLPIFFTGHRIDRWEGVLFLGYYLAYVGILILAATSHPGLAMARTALFGFALPLTALTLAVLSWRHWRGRGSPDPPGGSGGEDHAGGGSERSEDRTSGQLSGGRRTAVNREPGPFQQ